jgi:hypothetical protein
MRYLLLLRASFVELAASLGKWLFVFTAPVLLIVIGSLYRADHSTVEPILGLIFVTGVFVVTHLLSSKVDGLQVPGLRNGPEEFGVNDCQVARVANFWNSHLEEKCRKGGKGRGRDVPKESAPSRRVAASQPVGRS